MSPSLLLTFPRILSELLSSSPTIKHIELSLIPKLLMISLRSSELKNFEIPPSKSPLFTLNHASPLAPIDWA